MEKILVGNVRLGILILITSLGMSKWLLGIVKIFIRDCQHTFSLNSRDSRFSFQLSVFLLYLRTKQSCFFTYNFNFQITKTAFPNVHWYVTNAVFGFLSQDGTRQSKNSMDSRFSFQLLVFLLSLRVKQSCFFTYNFKIQVTKTASPNVHWHVTNAVFRFLCQDGTRQSKNWLDFSFLWESWNYVIFTPTFILLSGPEIEYFLPGFLNRATI